MAPKFNKTEQALLADAAKYGGRVGVDFGVDRRRTFGTRRHAAAVSLAKKGILVRVDAGGGGTNLYSKTGWGVVGKVYTSTWKLVDPT